MHDYFEIRVRSLDRSAPVRIYQKSRRGYFLDLLAFLCATYGMGWAKEDLRKIAFRRKANRLPHTCTDGKQNTEISVSFSGFVN